MIDVMNFDCKCRTLGLQRLYELSNIGNKDKVDLIDSEGYLYYLSSQNIGTLYRRKGTMARYFNNNPYTEYNINHYLELNKINIRLFNYPKNATDNNTEFMCLKHNKIFNRTWNVVKNGCVFCPECAKESYRSARCQSLDYIKDRMFKEYNITIIDNNYINNEEKLKFICNKHKDKGVQYKSWGNMQTKAHPCIYCSKELVIQNSRKSNDSFIKEVNEIHGSKYTVISEYKGSHKKVDVYCTKCNSVFSIKASHLLAGHGCGICTKSIGEERIKEFLDNNNVNYIREHRFEDCRGIKRLLPFDFYIPQFNICIEYQGVQHYQPVDIFGGIKAFKTQQTNDCLKKQYCESKHIKLIEIPYWKQNQINNILSCLL